MRIALDVMGGDHAPAVPVEGAVRAARLYGIEVSLVGPPEVIEAELARHDTRGLSLPIIPASQVVEMEDHVDAVRSKKDASMNVGARLVRHGQADGFVSAGHSGAVMATALFNIGRIPGVKRPALGTIYPTVKGHCFVLDVGANTECTPLYLLQFAFMGSTFMEKVYGIPRPTVALLSNGEEEDKGNLLVRQATPLVKASGLNFVGNAEGKDVPKGFADVIVTDGFSGNILIKLSEGLVVTLALIIVNEIKAGALGKLALLLAIPGAVLLLPTAALSIPALRRIAKRFYYAEFGGAHLLGVNGPVVVAHGRSNVKAIQNAIRVCKESVERGVVQTIREGVRDLPVG
jgi:glycerol-3-phosphate acyltransferase PlsX